MNKQHYKTTTNNNSNENNRTVIMAQVSSDNSTKHKHNKPVAVAQDREEVLSFSIRNSNNSKRKITTGDNVHGDERIIQQQRRVRKGEQSQLLRCWCTFHDFRVSTIQEHPSLIWLGPSSMAVYWFKEYLQTPMKQGWIRIPKKEPSAHPATAIKGTSIRTLPQRNKVERKPQQQKQKQNSKGNFYFIPGQYLRPDPPPCDGAVAATTTDTTTTTTTTISTGKNNNNSSSTIRIRMMIQNILKYGIPDIHYATSYIGVYNLIRSYGRFIQISKNQNQIQNNNSSNNKIGNRNSRSSSNKRRRCSKEEDEKEQQHQHQQNQKEDDEDMHIVIPFDYKGPDLIIPKEQQDD